MPRDRNSHRLFHAFFIIHKGPRSGEIKAKSRLFHAVSAALGWWRGPEIGLGDAAHLRLRAQQRARVCWPAHLLRGRQGVGPLGQTEAGDVPFESLHTLKYA